MVRLNFLVRSVLLSCMAGLCGFGFACPPQLTVQEDSNFAYLEQAIPAKSAAFMLIRLDAPNSQYYSQIIIDKILANAVPGLNFSVKNYKLVLSFALNQAGLGADSERIASGVSPRFAVAFNPPGGNAFYAAIKAKDSNATPLLLEKSALVIFQDSQASLLAKDLTHRKARLYSNGVIYYKLGIGNIFVYIAGDRIVLAVNPDLFFDVHQALAFHKSIEDSLSSYRLTNLIHPNALAAIVIANLSGVAAHEKPSLLTYTGPIALNFVIADNGIHLDLRAVLLDQDKKNWMTQFKIKSTAVLARDVNSAMPNKPIGQVILCPDVFDFPKIGKFHGFLDALFQGGIGIAVYADHITNGVPHGINLLVEFISKKNNQLGIAAEREIHALLSMDYSHKPLPVINLHIPGTQKVIALSPQLGHVLRSALIDEIKTKVPKYSELLSDKTLIYARSGNAVFLSTSLNLLKRGIASYNNRFSGKKSFNVPARSVIHVELSPSMILDLITPLVPSEPGVSKNFSTNLLALKLFKSAFAKPAGNFIFDISAQPHFVMAQLNFPFNMNILNEILNDYFIERGHGH